MNVNRRTMVHTMMQGDCTREQEEEQSEEEEGGGGEDGNP